MWPPLVAPKLTKTSREIYVILEIVIQENCFKIIVIFYKKNFSSSNNNPSIIPLSVKRTLTQPREYF